jgi:hypothetical protein
MVLNCSAISWISDLSVGWKLEGDIERAPNSHIHDRSLFSSGTPASSTTKTGHHDSWNIPETGVKIPKIKLKIKIRTFFTTTLPVWLCVRADILFICVCWLIWLRLNYGSKLFSYFVNIRFICGMKARRWYRTGPQQPYTWQVTFLV